MVETVGIHKRKYSSPPTVSLEAMMKTYEIEAHEGRYMDKNNVTGA